MPRYIVERTFDAELAIPRSAEGAELCQRVVQRNERDGRHVVALLRQRRPPARRSASTTGPTRRRSGAAATGNELPVDRITQVRVLDPYFHF